MFLLHTDLTGRTVWANVPYENVTAFLDHYEQEKGKDPSIAGMFVLPQWETAEWWSRLQQMNRVRHYARGTDLFTAPGRAGTTERVQMGTTQWPVNVFWAGFHGTCSRALENSRENVVLSFYKFVENGER